MIDSGTMEVVKGERPDSFVLKEIERSEKKLGGIEGAVKIVTSPNSSESENHRWKMVTKGAYVSEFNKDQCFGSEDEFMSDSRRYFERWKYLKSIGIPTVSSMRIIDNKILMGDMTADGSEFFDKHSNDDIRYVLADIDKDNRRELTIMERKFLEIDPEKIKTEISRIHDLAWDHGFVLPVQDREGWAMLLHPDGTWKIIVRDLSFMRHIRKETKKDGIITLMKDDKEAIRKSMLSIVDEMRENLLKINSNA